MELFYSPTIISLAVRSLTGISSGVAGIERCILWRGADGTKMSSCRDDDQVN
jgi:hypothetical protein